MSSARKRDKKVEVSLTNWFLGGSLVSGTSTTSSTRSPVRRLASLQPDNDSVLGKSSKAEKTEEKSKGEKKDKSKGGYEKCAACGKKKASSSDSKDSNAKSEDNKSKDDAKSDAGENKEEGGGESGGKGWTSDQDEKIKSMKGENRSWKDIALEVGASKKDVQNRYKELMKSSSVSGDGEKKDENTSNAWETKNDGNNNGWETVVENTDVGNDNMPDFGALFEDEPADPGERKGKEKSGWGNNNSSGGNWGNSGSGEKNDWGSNNNNGNNWDNSGSGSGDGEKKQESGGWDTKSNNHGNNNWDNSGSGDGGKKQKGGSGKSKNKDKQQNCGNNNDGGGNWGSNGGNNSSRDGGGGHKKNQESGGSGHSNPFDDSHAIGEEEEASKGKGRLKPDAVWTQDDCEVLEWLESKYEENKWLHMQAGFYNWTGRMVIAELIQKKFRDDGAA